MTIQHSRRRFIKTTALAGLAIAASSFEFKKYRPLLSFSTLGCPDWNFDTVLNFAADNNFNGVEIRGLLRQLDLSKCPEFSSTENILSSRKKAEEKGVKIVSLDASASLHYADPLERKANLDEAKTFINIARQINCPYVRVFPNNFPKEQERNTTIELISKGLIELGDYAKDNNVTVLMETHGDLVYATDIEKIMHLTAHPNVGLVWDIANMWTVTKEPVAQVYDRLKNYIHHTHIKDVKIENDHEDKHALLGRGNTPIFEAIDILAKNKFRGYYSFEWEKLWSPEIEEPEVAISDYSKVMRNRFNIKRS